MKKLLQYTAIGILVSLASTVCALSLGHAQDGPRVLPVPGNVSGDPKGVDPPKLSIDVMEMTPTLVCDAERLKVLADDSIDYSVEQVGAPSAWKLGITGKGVKVAVLDTGIDANHRDLKEGIVASKDFTGSRNGINDLVGHGTHCAGSIGARKNSWGLQGVAYECDLIVGKVLGDSGSGGVDGIAAGIRWAVDQGADVISMSLGGGGTDSFIPPALDYAKAAGVIVIVAAGNDGNGRPVNYPAAYEYCVAISAIDANKRLAPFSCTGTKVELCGPGVNVRSTYPGDKFADLSGTSMATPNVAGYAALFVQAVSGKVAKKERAAAFRKHIGLAASVTDLGAAGRDTSYGWGLPDGGKVPPPVTPPAPGGKLELTEADLTDAAKEKLKKAGFDTFRFTIGGPGGVTPPPPVPKITEEELVKRVTAGEKLIVAFGVPADAVKYPGILQADFLPDGRMPGVYEVKQVTKISLLRLDAEAAVKKPLWERVR